MTKKNQRMLRIHQPKTDNQSPVVVCRPDGTRIVVSSSTYHTGKTILDSEGKPVNSTWGRV